MYINPYNIEKGLCELLEANNDKIQEIIKAFYGSKTDKKLHVFKSVMPSLQQQFFPSLEMEPTNIDNKWITTEAEYCTYTIRFILTVNFEKNELGTNLLSTLARSIIEIFTYPSNRCFKIPNEIIWNPVAKSYTDAWVQYGDVTGLQFNSIKGGTIRIAQWNWTGEVIEGYNYEWYHNHDIDKIPDVPHPEPKK